MMKCTVIRSTRDYWANFVYRNCYLLITLRKLDSLFRCHTDFISLAVFGENPRYYYTLGVVVIVVIVQKH